MGLNIAQKLIRSHLAEGEMRPGAAIALTIDQTLTQDATGTLVMLALQAMELDRVKTEVSAQYVDHNLLQVDHRNADDHVFLRSACQRYGIWYSPPGTGVSHPVHMQRFGIPGKTLLGSDSHTCAAGSLGMLAIGAGGLDVAMAMAGGPFRLRMPQIWGVTLSGRLPDWVSAKDVILELLRRHDVDGGINRIIEYRGPGVAGLSAMDRHVIANMGAELGATSTVFPSDAQTRRFLRSQGREEAWQEIIADEDATYDVEEEIDLTRLEPLIALPSSPGNVVPVREVEGEPVYQAYIGSSANPGYRDFAVPAMMVRDRCVADGVSFDINPTSRQLVERLTREGHLLSLLGAGARLHQAGCNGCIGMGQAPATGRNSLRTVPRNFPGRSGTREDSVFLCSPETAAAAALTGRITDPRGLGFDYPKFDADEAPVEASDLFLAPLPLEESRRVQLEMGPNIAELPPFEALPEGLELPVLLKVGDNVSTDEILPAGAEVLPYRSNIPKIAEFAFARFGSDYVQRARKLADAHPHCVVGGSNYGQGSSREHAALAPRYLGLRAVLVKSFARIHRQNLINHGVLPLRFRDPGDYERIEVDEVVVLTDLHNALHPGQTLSAGLKGGGSLVLQHDLNAEEIDVVRAGGLIAWSRRHVNRAC